MIKARKRIAAGLLAFAFLATSVFTMPITAKAASSFEKVTASTVIDNKYSFSPRFITGVTTMETFGATSTYEDDCWATNENLTYNSTFKPVRLTSNSQKGKVGAIYHNVGEYKGKQVDLKITIMDWDELKDPYMITSKNKMAYPSISFNGKNISVTSSNPSVKRPVYRFEFQQNGKTISLAGHMTFTDVDVSQYVDSNTFDKGYLTSNTELMVSGNKVYSNTNGADMSPSDTRYWVTYTWEGSYFEYAFNDQQTDDRDFSKKVSFRGMSTMNVTGDSLARFDTPAPIKSGPASVVAGDDVSYNVSFTVPKQPSDYLYSKFVLSDTLPNGLKYKSFSVADDTGKDVTSNFTGSINGQEFTLSAKNLSSSSFYFKGYTVTINATCEDKDYKDQQGSDGKVILKNQASITAQNTSTPETKTSNTVNTEVKFKITTSTDGNGSISVHKSNGTIDPTSIPGGTDAFVKTEPKAGYKEDKLYIDGDDNLSNHFYNITSNHTVYATFTPETDRVVVLEKWIHKDDVNIANGTPTVIFKLEGTDLNGKKHTYYESQELDERMLEGDYYIFKTGFSGLTAGTYTASEVKTSRYALDSVYEKKFNFDLGENEYIKLDGDVLNCDLVNNQNIKGKFLNKRTKIQGFSHNDLKVNVFGGGTSPVK